MENTLEEKSPKSQSTNYQYQLDQIFGDNSENNTLKTLRILLNDDTLQHYRNKYSILDFHSNKLNLICEVKGRRVSSKAYPTTMLGVNKTDLAKDLYNQGNTILFFFDFTDGLFYFDFKDFDSITQHRWFRKQMGGTKKRGLIERKVHNYIPVCMLTKVENYNKGSIDYIRTHKYTKPKNLKKIPIENFIVCKN